MTYKSAKRSIFSFLLMTGVMMTSTGPAQASETTLQRIQREGVLHAATEPEFEPFEFMQDGNIVGYGTDVLHAVAQRMGVKLDQQAMPFSAILPGLQSGKFDLAATTLVATPEREKKFAFTSGISDLPFVIVVRADNNTIHGETDFSGKKVGAQQASVIEAGYRVLDKKLQKEKGQGITDIVTYQSYPDTLLAVKNKQIDATVVSLPMAANWIKRFPGEYKIANWWKVGGQDKQSAVWAVRLEDQDFKTALNDIFHTMERDGTLDTLQTKWFGKTLKQWQDTNFDK